MHVPCSECGVGITPLMLGEEPWQARFLDVTVPEERSDAQLSTAFKIQM